MKKIIFCNGDSFMAGDELAMSEFYPEFSALRSCNDFTIPSDKQQEKWREHTIADLPKFFQYREKCKTYAYPNIIASELNIPVINKAVGGQSNQAITSITYEYLEEKLLKEYNPAEILVVCHLTSFHRIKVPNYQDTNTDDSSTTVLLTYKQPKYDEVRKFFLEHASDRYLLADTAMHIFGLIKYLEARGIDYILTDSSLYRRNVEAYKFTHSKEQIDLLPIPDPDYFMDHYINFQANELCMCQLGHYSKVIHDRFGKFLASKIKELYFPS